MATYVIGDVHGCYEALRALARAIDFGPRDRLWFVGDLVNTGPRSAEVVRWVAGLGDRAQVVLGNHDLHLLAVWYGQRPFREKDTFSDLLEAPDAPELIDFLATRPLIWRDGPDAIAHAGLHPSWSWEEARHRAREAEDALGADREGALGRMYGNEPADPSRAQSAEDRLRSTINVLTRMRALKRGGALEFRFKRAPEQMPSDLSPWYAHEGAWTDEIERLFFGHWSALGVRELGSARALDGGCVWGGRLCALRREDGALFSVAPGLDEARAPSDG